MMKISRNKKRIWNAAAAHVVHTRAQARARYKEKESDYPTQSRAFIALRYGAKGTYTAHYPA